MFDAVFEKAKAGLKLIATHNKDELESENCDKNINDDRTLSSRK